MTFYLYFCSDWLHNRRQKVYRTWYSWLSFTKIVQRWKGGLYFAQKISIFSRHWVTFSSVHIFIRFTHWLNFKIRTKQNYGKHLEIMALNMLNRICIWNVKELNAQLNRCYGVFFSLNTSELPFKCAFLVIQVDRYEGPRSLDDLKNYLTLKISEHSLLSSAITENSESAEEIPSDATDMETQVIEKTCQTGTTSLFRK